jgi:hypothetical protein
MIKGLQCAETKKLFMREKPGKLPESIFRGGYELERLRDQRGLAGGRCRDGL